jgi:hypothetical protein
MPAEEVHADIVRRIQKLAAFAESAGS